MSTSKKPEVTIDAVAIHAVGQADEINKLDVMKGMAKIVQNIVASSAAQANASIVQAPTALAIAATPAKKSAPKKPAAKPVVEVKKSAAKKAAPAPKPTAKKSTKATKPSKAAKVAECAPVEADDPVGPDDVIID